MDAKRVLLAGMVLALTVGCTEAATEASGTAGFAVIADHEAAQILGGDGWDCNDLRWGEGWERKCDGTEEECSFWLYWYETWQCEAADSGQCDPYGIVIGLRWGGCVWYPESGVCGRDGTAEDVPVYGCVP